MEFLDCVRGRRSVRQFTGEPVAHEKIERAVQAASYAPSWKNHQIARYLVIEDPALKERIAAECMMGRKYNAAIVRGAPALVLVNIVTGLTGYAADGSFATSKGDRWEMFDAGLAAQTFCLAAYDMGLGTVIMGVFDEDAVAGIVGLPAGRKVAALIAIGHPAEAPDMPRRKAAAELVMYR